MMQQHAEINVHNYRQEFFLVQMSTPKTVLGKSAGQLFEEDT